MIIRETGVTREMSTRIAAEYAPRIPWDEFVRTVFHPVNSEHISIFGSTGKGKTTLQNEMLSFFPFVTVFATKPQDESIDKLLDSRRYVKMARWYRLSPTEVPRRVLWPDATGLRAMDLQKRVFTHAMDAIYREVGRPKHKPIGWALSIDEAWYFNNMLGMGRDIKVFMTQARSSGHSLLLATQRPSGVPLEMYSQANHIFLFRERERRNLERLGEINSADSGVVRAIVSYLEEHQVLYINTETGTMWRTRIFPYMVNHPRY